MGSQGSSFTSNNASPPFVATAGFLAESNPSPSHNGVRQGEYLDVIFALQGGGTYGDVLSELMSGELRLGMHVIAFQSGGSVSLINAPVIPVPAAVWLFGSGLIALGGLRRRS
ncbi:MAG: VPLPA-CTERM sorting domain-containing protein [Gammaproteobacteria bacterium]|nr:VPLPA-CTERM sorting domain-containing protein [Gammaproteobacteria bacterium]